MELNTFIKNWLDSWTGNRPEVLLAFYSDHAFYSDPAFPNGISGKESLKNYFGKLLYKNPDWVWEAVEIIPTEKGCSLKWKATIPTPNQTITLFGLDIVEISDWKITRNEVYFDRVPWLEAIR